MSAGRKAKQDPGAKFLAELMAYKVTRPPVIERPPVIAPPTLLTRRRAAHELGTTPDELERLTRLGVVTTVATRGGPKYTSREVRQLVDEGWCAGRQA